MMKEDFLHYVWKFQKFDAQKLMTVQGESLSIQYPGQHNFNSGPDFFNAQLLISGQLWAGNVELHLKASHWYQHHHETDDAYDNVILHVVWEHDADIFRKDNTLIPTLEMKHIVYQETRSRYRALFIKTDKWINCENDFPGVSELVLANWLDRLYIERLEEKARYIFLQLDRLKGHWEALLFQLLSKNFGLKINSEAFLSMSRAIDFRLIKKCNDHSLDLEALFFGQSGLLGQHLEEGYFTGQKNRYKYLQRKFNLDTHEGVTPIFFRLRPPNFPTVRLSQLAVLYTIRKHLFSDIIAANTLEEFYKIFDISASTYWDTHYNFAVPSVKRKKKLTRKFIELLIINTVIPLKFCYAQRQGISVSDELLQLASILPKEENTIVRRFNEMRPCVNNSIESQAVLHLKKKYCDNKKCTQCAVGVAILKDVGVPEKIQ